MNAQDVDSATNTLNESLLSLMNKCFPVRTVTFIVFTGSPLDDSPCQVSVIKEVESQCFWECGKSQGVIEEGYRSSLLKISRMNWDRAETTGTVCSGGVGWIVSLKGKTNHSLS